MPPKKQGQGQGKANASLYASSPALSMATSAHSGKNKKKKAPEGSTSGLTSAENAMGGSSLHMSQLQTSSKRKKKGGNASSGRLNASGSIHVSSLQAPSDAQLRDQGWAKQWDSTQNAYYYYRVDGDASTTTWDNPLVANKAKGKKKKARKSMHQSYSQRDDSDVDDAEAEDLPTALVAPMSRAQLLAKVRAALLEKQNAAPEEEETQEQKKQRIKKEKEEKKRLKEQEEAENAINDDELPRHVREKMEKSKNKPAGGGLFGASSATLFQGSYANPTNDSYSRHNESAASLGGSRRPGRTAANNDSFTTTNTSLSSRRPRRNNHNDSFSTTTSSHANRPLTTMSAHAGPGRMPRPPSRKPGGLGDSMPIMEHPTERRRMRRPSMPSIQSGKMMSDTSFRKPKLADASQDSVRRQNLSAKQQQSFRKKTKRRPSTGANNQDSLSSMPSSHLKPPSSRYGDSMSSMQSSSISRRKKNKMEDSMSMSSMQLSLTGTGTMHSRASKKNKLADSLASLQTPSVHSKAPKTKLGASVSSMKSSTATGSLKPPPPSAAVAAAAFANRLLPTSRHDDSVASDHSISAAAIPQQLLSRPARRASVSFNEASMNTSIPIPSHHTKPLATASSSNVASSSGTSSGAMSSRLLESTTSTMSYKVANASKATTNNASFASESYSSMVTASIRPTEQSFAIDSGEDSDASSVPTSNAKPLVNAASANPMQMSASLHMSTLQSASYYRDDDEDNPSDDEEEEVRKALLQTSRVHEGEAKAKESSEEEEESDEESEEESNEENDSDEEEDSDDDEEEEEGSDDEEDESDDDEGSMEEFYDEENPLIPATHNGNYVPRTKHHIQGDDYQGKYVYPLPVRICSILVLCVLLAGLAALVLLFVFSCLYSAAEGLPPTAAPTPTPMMLPDYTLLALQDPKSPQSQALTWVLNDPNYTSYDLGELYARLGLRTIYYSVGGPSWTGSAAMPEGVYPESECGFGYYDCPKNVPRTPAPVTMPDFQAGGGVNLSSTKTRAPAAAPTSPGTPTKPLTLPKDTAAIGGSNTGISPGEPINGQIVPRHAGGNNAESDPPQRHRELYKAKYGWGTTLDLTEYATLVGSIPPEIGLLTDLQSVLISNNPSLTGKIPPQLRFLRPRLFTLYLENNGLTGTVPTLLGQLEHLRELRLNSNALTGGIPSQFAMITALNMLHLYNNKLNGKIPPELAVYPFFHEVLLQNNALTGTLPSFANPNRLSTLTTVPSAEAMTVDSNVTQDSLPFVSRLKTLTLNNNKLTGTIPTEMGLLTDLEVLQLHANNLVGRVPWEVCTLLTLHNLKLLSVDCKTVICPCECTCPTGGEPQYDKLLLSLPQATRDIIITGGITRPDGTVTLAPQSLAYKWLQADPAVDVYSEAELLQRFALATLYYATNLPPDYKSWNILDGWLDYDNGGECNWASAPQHLFRRPDPTDDYQKCLSTSDSGGSAESLYQILALSNNQLSGILPPELALLTELKKLECHENQLNGSSISLELMTITSLEVLDLENTGIAGPIPSEIGQLQNVRKVYFGQNALSGKIPDTVWTLSALDSIDVGLNQLTGTLSDSVTQLSSSLEYLYVTQNHLTGTLPSLQQMTNLRELYLDQNKFIGKIDDLPWESSSLVQLVMTDNQLTGRIPSSIGSLENLEVLMLGKNQLRGTLPTEVATMSKLKWLHLSFNLLTGTIPAIIGQLTNLVELYANANELQGQLPSQLGLLTNLQSLSLDTNRLSGRLPKQFGAFRSIRKLKLDHNNLAGTLPTELGKLQNSLNWLDFSWNQLTGPLPSELGRLSSVNWIYVERNSLRGPLPTELGNILNIQELSLYGNQFTGTIPTELGRLAPTVQGIFLHENYLQGTIPSELGLLTELRSIWLHITGITGTVPTELCALVERGSLVTLAVDCLKVTCTCGCNCPAADSAGDGAVNSVLEGRIRGSNVSKNAMDRSYNNMNDYGTDWKTPPKLAFEDATATINVGSP